MKFTPLLLGAALSLAPTLARAQRAEYAQPSEVMREGLRHVVDLSLGGEFLGAIHTPLFNPLDTAGGFYLRSRNLLGGTGAYCVGADADLLGGSGGFGYRVQGYLAGAGLRWGEANFASLCGGVGVSRIGSAVPTGGRIPVELRVAQNLGPVRLNLWANAGWIFGSDFRQNGSGTFKFTDEFELGLSVRFARQRHYWSTYSAGGGVSFGVMYREFMQAQTLSFTLGIDLTGAR